MLPQVVNTVSQKANDISLHDVEDDQSTVTVEVDTCSDTDDDDNEVSKGNGIVEKDSEQIIVLSERLKCITRLLTTLRDVETTRSRFSETGKRLMSVIW
jgi:hypothetical protein